MVESQPDVPLPLDSFRLFAIVCAWMEGDVIGATVRNAFAQGCERVFLVDNDSPDDTVAEALTAGAELARSFGTEQFEEQMRFDLMNEVVREVSAAEGADHIWWLWIDADEFPQGPHGRTVREHLAALDRRFRIVGARWINHYPDRDPAYVRGFHPLEFQTLSEEHLLVVCPARHRKHPLQRYDRGAEPIECGLGIHLAHSNDRPLKEPDEPIFVHHFPYREPATTRRRLEQLCAKDEAGNARVKDGDTAVDGMVPRFQTLDAVYRGDWEQVRNYRGVNEFAVARPVPWSSIAAPDELAVPRWYPAPDVAT
ncbi:MAG TPA: glycosyltransferase family 2 protein [Acidimicrobiia bacterium]|nr:glycosyltransferase family 2 protein [Acidimicrobiia bacterium]